MPLAINEARDMERPVDWCDAADRLRRENFKEYLEKYGLAELYQKASKYLKLPPPESVEVEKAYEPAVVHCVAEKMGIAAFLVPFVGAYVRTKKDGGLVVGFTKSQDPPDRAVFLNVLVILASGKRTDALVYGPLLRYAVENDLPPFNLFWLNELTLKDVEEVLRRFGIDGVDGYLRRRGVFEDEELKKEPVKIKWFLMRLGEKLKESELDQQIFKRLIDVALDKSLKRLIEELEFVDNDS